MAAGLLTFLTTNSECDFKSAAYTIVCFTLSLSMASSPPGVDMIRSWMLVTD